MRYTIFTPSYNRGYIIDKLYLSLKRQTFKDFEWIVINDGSTDNTDETFQRILIEDNDLDIKYISKVNGGKHRAINDGVRMATGELFFIVDSDDFLPDNALEIINCWEKSIPPKDKSKYCGVCGLRFSAANQKIIGTTFDGDYIDCTCLERPLHNITGDKAEVVYTQILKNYTFPEFDGENFMTECIVWDKMAFDGYKFRFFNEAVYYGDYLSDGLSHNSKIFTSNPKGWGLCIYQSIMFGKISKYDIWKEYLKYYYELNGKISTKEISRNLHVSPILFRVLLFSVLQNKRIGYFLNKLTFLIASK